jgi:hypothetical protein
MRTEFPPLCAEGEPKPHNSFAKSIAGPLRGQALAALGDSELRDRFYSWRGASGRRYVCSVFPADNLEDIAESWSAAVIGVVNHAGARHPVYVVSCDQFRALNPSDACAQGVNEWHVHFGADEAELRDLCGSANA